MLEFKFAIGASDLEELAKLTTEIMVYPRASKDIAAVIGNSA
jgi:hypothetical protein